MRRARKSLKGSLYSIGDLNHIIAILKRENRAAPAGAVVARQEYTEVLTTWAGLRLVNDFERKGGINPGSSITHKFIIRWQAELQNLETGGQHFLMCQGNYYRIDEIVLESDRFMVLKCSARGQVDKAGAQS